MCRDSDNWCEKRADRTRPIRARLACFLAWLVQAKLISITGKKNCAIQVPPPNQPRTVELKTLRTKLKCQYSPPQIRDGNWAELTFAKTSGTVTKNREKNWPIADQPVPCNDPRINRGTHFRSSSLLFPKVATYILSYMVSPCPPEFYFPSDTKKETDLSLPLFLYFVFPV